VGKTGGALNIRINNYRHFCTFNKPDTPVSLHTESHNTNFDLSFLVAIIHILFPHDQHLKTPSVGRCLCPWFKRENVS